MTGIGKHITTSLLQTQVATLSHIAANYLNCGVEGKRIGTSHANIVPYQAIRTADGYLVICATNDRQFVSLCEVLDLPEISKDERFTTNPNRVKHRNELIEILE